MDAARYDRAQHLVNVDRLPGAWICRCGGHLVCHGLLKPDRLPQACDPPVFRVQLWSAVPQILDIGTVAGIVTYHGGALRKRSR